MAQIADQTIDDALADPRTYTDEVSYHALLTRLRHDDPVHWTKPTGYRPFWTITRHSLISEIERQPELFASAPRSVLRSVEQENSIRGFTGSVQPMRSLIQMDQPDHRTFRKLTQAWFMPKHLKTIEAAVDRLSNEFIDKMKSFNGECDFTEDVAIWFPLRTVMHILGVPPEDAALMLKLTQQHFASTDPSVAQSGVVKAGSALQEVFDYFAKLAAERRRSPREDAVSLLVQATIDDKPIPDFELYSYLALLAVAGHDSTSSSISGMMHALIERPEQLARLRSDIGLLPSAVEEGIRWTSPVRHFFRTATTDIEVGNQKIRTGDSVMLSYPSANRDEDVFEDPFEFRIDRAKNPHMSFGHGPHLCLGQNLAKLEMKSFFSRLLPKLESIELVGEPRWIETNFVGGLKSLPVRYRMSK